MGFIFNKNKKSEKSNFAPFTPFTFPVSNNKQTEESTNQPDSKKYPIEEAAKIKITETSPKQEAARELDDFSFLDTFLKGNESAQQPSQVTQPIVQQPAQQQAVNITKEEDSMIYSSDLPQNKKDKPDTPTNESIEVDMPSMDNKSSVSAKHDKTPDFSECVTTEKEESVDILTGSSNEIDDQREIKYPFMRDMRLAAKKAGYGIIWQEKFTVYGEMYIQGSLTSIETNTPINNKAFFIDTSGSIYNRLIKIFMIKPDFYIEASNGYPLYSFDKNTKTSIFNEQLIVNLLKGGEDAVSIKDAVYKGGDKAVNAFVDMASIDKCVRGKNNKRVIKDRIFAAYKQNAFYNLANRFSINRESVKTRDDGKVAFTLVNDAPKHFGEYAVQSPIVEMRFDFEGMTIFP